MDVNTNIFRIETNHVIPSPGKLLISEPFLYDETFGRSVVLLLEHAAHGCFGLIMNKPMPSVTMKTIFPDIHCVDDIPVYKGGPLNSDKLFYLHTYEGIPHSVPALPGYYINGDIELVKERLEEEPYTLRGKIRFFLGYSGWDYDQLNREVRENSWLIGDEDIHSIMSNFREEAYWKDALSRMGGKYELWSRFPLIPTLN